MRKHLSALRARYEPAASRAFNAAGHVFSLATRATVRALAVTGSALRRAALAVLEAIETVLLSPAGRERIHAIATFSLIFLFAVASVDFLISGGPEFGAPAREAQPQPQRMVRVWAPPSAGVSAAPTTIDEAVPTALSPSLADAREANVIALSQNFAAPVASVERPAAIEARVDVSPQVEGLADGAGDVATEARATDEAQPRKHVRRKGERTPA
jgi:hypothetical protein